MPNAEKAAKTADKPSKISPWAWALVALLFLLPTGYWLYHGFYTNPEEVRQQQKQQIEGFVGNYFAATERADIEALLNAYAERVDYFHWGPTNRAAVRMDKTSFFDKWPEVRYALISDLELMDGLGKKEVVSVSFLMGFYTHNPNKYDEAFNTIEGKARHTWKLIKEDGQYKIISEKQQVIERKRYHKALNQTSS